MEILIIGLGYLLGSIPSGYLAGKWILKIDIRELGSGSTGATNVLRHVGKFPALIVFLIDVIKGILPVVIARSYQLNDYWQVAAGLAALVGHIWPIWLRGKGGKAVATGLGMLLGLTWQVGLASFGTFLGVLAFTRIVSVSSISAALSLPILMFFSFSDSNFKAAYFGLSVITMIIVIYKHKANIKRLLAGKEPRIGQS